MATKVDNDEGVKLQRQRRWPSAAIASLALVAAAVVSSLSLLQGGGIASSSQKQKKQEPSLPSRKLLTLETDPKSVTDKQPIPEQVQSLDFPTPSDIVHDLHLPAHDDTGHFQPLLQQPDTSSEQPPLQPYNLLNVLAAYPAFHRELFILWYDFETDRFLVFIDESKDTWIEPVRNRISVIAAPITTALRHHFAHRFPEWVPRRFEEGAERMAWIREQRLEKKRRKIELEWERGRRDVERERKERLGDKYEGDFVEDVGGEDDHEDVHEVSRARLNDFALLFSSGDLPEIDHDCIPDESILADPLSPPSKLCRLDEAAPILHFGSVFKDERILPSSVTMPVWHHAKCITQWQWHGTICSAFQPVVSHQMDVEKEENTKRGEAGLKGMVFGPEMGLPDYDDLVPQLIWRGTNFGFLHCFYPLVRGAEWDFDIQPHLERLGDDARGVLAAIVDIWSLLTPRWKGVVLSATAELEVQTRTEELENQEPQQQQDRNRFLRFLAENDVAEPEPMSTMEPEILPWIDAKFVIKTEMFGEPVNDNRADKYQPFQEHGIQVLADYMPPEEMAGYKYHIDFGGGGGTAWSGTTEKLAMPGLLFHHVTPTKDYFHDDLEPWKHYVPVATDLSDLREMFHWAERNPIEARAIAETGTEFARQMGTPETYNARYRRYFIESLGRVVDAYRPLEVKGVPKKWQSLTVAGSHPGMNKMTLVATCTGFHEKCTFVGRKPRKWSE